ncbi:MAG: penicillin-binding protein, partial [Altererythrobacter sp.]|nr:penicillin-binding protein [Altererythrobacter sp.]
RVLVAPTVAAQMTDLLQTAVNTGTGRAAQIGRPVAGKTGTTSSNKDGYFVGFSSGVTTGVWMGRDDNRRVGGLQGGRAPAQAFAAFMRYAVKDRPIEEFETEVQVPEWQLDEEDDFFFGDPDDYYYIDEQGNLIEPGRSEGPGGALPEPRDQSEQDSGVEVTRPQQPRVQRVPPPRPQPSTGRGEDGAPQAIDDDFLDGVIGRDR